MRIAIFIVGAIATVMALTVDSVYTLWALCSDVVYVTLFPQLCCVIYFDKTNTYGSFVGFIVGIVLRVLGGEPSLKIPAVIKYPYYTAADGQLFPFRTLAMVCAFASILIVSYLLRILFLKRVIPIRMDFLYCFREYSLNQGLEMHGAPTAKKDKNSL
jgi:high affinity choline transporter 7